MNRERIYYSIIGGGLLLVVGIVVWRVWPEPEEPLEPPAVLVEKLETAPPQEKVQAAQDFIRHGPAARIEVRRSLEHHQNYEPEVLQPLLQATAKHRVYRSMPTLIELLDHPDPNVRGYAGAAITKIFGADYGYRADMPEDQRRQMIERIEVIHQGALPQLQDHYPQQTQ